MHVSHVRDRSAPFGIVVDITDARVKVRRGHWSESLLVNQLDGAVAVCHGNVLEQAQSRSVVRLFRGRRWCGIRDGKLRNGYRRRQTPVKYCRLV